MAKYNKEREFTMIEILSELKNKFPNLDNNFKPRGCAGELFDWAKQGGSRTSAFFVTFSMLSFCASRHYYTPTLSPLHLYNVVEGGGATGKKQVFHALIKLMEEIGYQSTIGPTAFKDTEALENFLVKCPRSIILMSKLEDMQGFHEYWSSNESVYLQNGKIVFNPAPVLVIKSLTSEFNKFFTRDEFLKGTASRLLVCNETHSIINKYVSGYSPIDNSVIDALKKLADGEGRDDSQVKVTPVPLKWENEETSDLYYDIKQAFDIIKARSDLHAACYGEGAEMALRLASLSALGRNSMTIDKDDLNYVLVVIDSANKLYELANKVN